MSDQPVIRLMAEGALFEIFARTTADGRMIFWSRDVAMGDDPDEWHGGGLPETTDLAEVVPESWPRLHPRFISPEVRTWFRERFDPESSNEHLATEWLAMFASTPPDRWNEVDPW